MKWIVFSLLTITPVAGDACSAPPRGLRWTKALPVTSVFGSDSTNDERIDVTGTRFVTDAGCVAEMQEKTAFGTQHRRLLLRDLQGVTERECNEAKTSADAVIVGDRLEYVAAAGVLDTVDRCMHARRNGDKACPEISEEYLDLFSGWMAKRKLTSIIYSFDNIQPWGLLACGKYMWGRTPSCSSFSFAIKNGVFVDAQIYKIQID